MTKRRIAIPITNINAGIAENNRETHICRLRMYGDICTEAGIPYEQLRTMFRDNTVKVFIGVEYDD